MRKHGWVAVWLAVAVMFCQRSWSQAPKRLDEMIDPLCGMTSATTKWSVTEAATNESYLSAGAAAAGKDYKGPTPLEPYKVLIPLDDTGIADWDFLNRRAPFPLVRRKIELGRLFRKRDPVEAGCFEAALPFVTLAFDNRTVDRTFVVAVPFEYPPDGAKLTKALQEIELFQRALPPGAPSSTFENCPALANSLNSFSPSDILAVDPNTGKSKLAACEDELSALEASTFPQRSLATKLKVLLTTLAGRLKVFDPANDPKTNPLAGLEATKPCKGKAAPLSCSAAITVGPRGTVELGGDFLTMLPKGRISLGVVLLGEIDTLPNSTGYLATVANGDLSAVASETTWSVAASVGLTRDADPTTDPDPSDSLEVKSFTVDNPYDGGNLSHFTGGASTDLRRTLGDRADASVSFRFKSGDLGGEDKTRNFTVPQYIANVYGLNGLGLRFGKYTLAAPTSKLAITEEGEAAELRWRWFSAGRIFKRESASGKPDLKNDDSEVTIFQASNLAPRGSSFLRALNLIGVLGEDKASKVEYETFGGQALFARPSSTVSASLAYYKSERESDRDHSGPERKGEVGLLSVTYARVIVEPTRNTKRQQTFTFEVGRGSGDEAKTTDIDEGYLGEGSAFSPGDSFLGTFAGKIDTGGNGSVVGSLSNKIYFGGVYTDYSFSPLVAVSHLLGLTENPTTQQSSVAVRIYRFVEPVFGEREAGTAVDFTTKIEVPAGVTASLGFSYFFPGDALQDFFKEEPWTITTSLQVKLDK